MYITFNDRKVTFKAKHNKIHLNLSIALLLGLIVFVGGIETAKNNEVSRAFNVHAYTCISCKIHIGMYIYIYRHVYLHASY